MKTWENHGKNHGICHFASVGTLWLSFPLRLSQTRCFVFFFQSELLNTVDVFADVLPQPLRLSRSFTLYVDNQLSQRDAELITDRLRPVFRAIDPDSEHMCPQMKFVVEKTRAQQGMFHCCCWSFVVTDYANLQVDFLCTKEIIAFRR